MLVTIVDSVGKQLTTVLQDKLQAINISVQVVTHISAGIDFKPDAMIIIASGNDHLEEFHLLEKVDFSVIWCYRPVLDAFPQTSPIVSGFFSRASTLFFEDLIAFLLRI